MTPSPRSKSTSTRHKRHALALFHMCSKAGDAGTGSERVPRRASGVDEDLEPGGRRWKEVGLGRRSELRARPYRSLGSIERLPLALSRQEAGERSSGGRGDDAHAQLSPFRHELTSLLPPPPPPRPENAVRTYKYSPDGRYFASASATGCVGLVLPGGSVGR